MVAPKIIKEVESKYAKEQPEVMEPTISHP
jgi:hypothetical protein